MSEIGVRELKRHASEILRRVKEDKETVIITLRGCPVAKLVPVEDDDALLAEMDELAEEIGRHWPAGVSAVEAIRGNGE